MLETLLGKFLMSVVVDCHFLLWHFLVLRSNQPNLIELALQNQALAAIGGQFSQLGFMSHNQQYRYTNTSSNNPSTVGFNMPGIFGNPLLNTAPKMPKLSFAASSRLQHHRRISHPQSSASTAKRTRLENPQVGSSSTGNNRSVNLVPLIASKRGSISPKSTASGDSSSSVSKKRASKTNDSVISDKLSGMTVDNGFDLQSSKLFIFFEDIQFVVFFVTCN